MKRAVSPIASMKEVLPTTLAPNLIVCVRALAARPGPGGKPLNFFAQETQSFMYIPHYNNSRGSTHHLVHQDFGACSNYKEAVQ